MISRPEGNGSAFGGAREVERGGVKEISGEEIAIGEGTKEEERDVRSDGEQKVS